MRRCGVLAVLAPVLAVTRLGGATRLDDTSGPRALVASELGGAGNLTNLTGLPSFFLYELPPRLNTELVDAYVALYGADPTDDTLPHGKCDAGDEACTSLAMKRKSETAQYSADVALHRALLAHPARVLDAAAADVLYVPWYYYLSSALDGKRGVNMLDDFNCNNYTFGQQVELLVETLLAAPEFSRRPEHHVLPMQAWYRGVETAWYLGQMDRAFKATIKLTIDPFLFNLATKNYEFHNRHSNINMWPEPAMLVNRLIPIPYVPTTALQQADVVAASEREFTLAFYGNTDLDTCKGYDHIYRGWSAVLDSCKLRAKLVEALSDRANCSVGASKKAANAYATTTNATEAAGGYFAALRHSKFCLAPRGDTPSSRRLYDSVVAGCIPVLIADDMKLPYQSVLDWDSFMVRVSEADALRDPAAIADRLEALPDETVSRMQAALGDARASMLYGAGGATAVLREVQQELRVWLAFANRSHTVDEVNPLEHPPPLEGPPGPLRTPEEIAADDAADAAADKANAEGAVGLFKRDHRR